MKLLRIAPFLKIGLCLQTLLVAGCAGSIDESNGQLEHHRPDHKPPTFPAAVEQLAQRHERIVVESHRNEAGALERELHEQMDIVNWLPELAADSALKKQDWEQVQTASKELLNIYQQVDATVHGSPSGEWPAAVSKIPPIVETLTRLVPRCTDQL